MEVMTVGKPDALAVTKKDRTAIYLLLDASGSMFGNKEEHLGGVNGYLEKLRNDGNYYTITIRIFSSGRSEVLREGNLEDVDYINNDEYITTGGTPLLDATWETIGKAEVLAEKDDRVIVIVQTDGAENSSMEVKLEDLKKKIEDKRSDGWLFEFLGMGIDKFQGGAMGFAKTSVDSYTVAESKQQWRGTATLSATYAATGRRPEDIITSKS